MTWTHEKPTKPGWYWWRYESDTPRFNWEVRYITKYAIDKQTLLGQFAGPLDPPAAEEGEDD